MANEDVIHRLTIQGSAPGVDAATGSVNKFKDATAALADVTDTSAKRALSAQAAYDRQTQSLDPAAKAQANIAKATKTATDALNQGLITQADYSKRIQDITTKYTTQTGASAALSKATQAVQLQFAAMAGGLGIAGQVLSAFGPWGFAAAVGLGAVQSGLGFVSDASHALAQKSKEISEFSDAVGVSTTQFQGLRSEAGKFGIDSETLAGGLSKFTAGFQELRLGTGNLLADIRRINPALADQMQRTTDSATAFTLFGKAVSQTSDIFERNALLKTGLGKGAAQYGAFFASAPDVNALAKSFADAGKGIDENLIGKLKQLQIDIDKTRSAASTIFSTTFGTSTLQEEKEWAETLLKLAIGFKGVMDSFSTPPAWFTRFIDVVSTGTTDPLAQAKSKMAGMVGLGITSAVKPDSIYDSVPMPKSYNQIVSDNKIGPVSEAKAPLTPQADLARLQGIVTLLGTAATSTEKYSASQAQLKIAFDQSGLSQDYFARALGALQLDKATADQTACVAALGAVLTALEIFELLSKELEALNDSDQHRMSAAA